MGIVVSAFAAYMLVFSFDTPLIDSFKGLWLVAMSIILCVRFILAWRWKTDKLSAGYDGQKSINQFVAGTYITAIMWCLYGLVVSSYSNSLELATILISYCALSGGATTVLSAHKHASTVYTLILLLPISIGLLLSEESYRQSLGIMSLIYSTMMSLTAKKITKFINKAIVFKNENAILAQEMEERVERRTQTIYRLSNLDPLTHLFNRTAFLKHFKEQLDHCVKHDISMALLFIDLDGFKKINDTFGHEVGDQLLLATSERLQQYYNNDQLLCRWGGDEFLSALKNCTEDEVIEHGNQLINMLSEPYNFNNNHLSVTATIGVALYPKHSCREDELIQLADTAMYYQKKHSPSTVSVFSTALGEQLAREQKLKDALAQAIEKDQLQLVFQPIVYSHNKQLKAFEALLRWHFDEEDICPDEFITLAEQFGHISQIGAWALNQACVIASQWDRDKAIAVCINVSIIQLQEDDFIDIVDKALANSQLPAELLHIEITESVFADDKKTVLEHIKTLQKRGIKVSIDDFGTGYSSLSVMQELCVDVVKIDRSFVETLETNGAAIISAVMNIADTLNYMVVAEGVETNQQAEALSAMGVHFQQGYYYSKPIEQHKVNGYINRH